MEKSGGVGWHARRRLRSKADFQAGCSGISIQEVRHLPAFGKKSIYERQGEQIHTEDEQQQRVPLQVSAGIQHDGTGIEKERNVANDVNRKDPHHQENASDKIFGVFESGNSDDDKYDLLEQ